MGLVVQFNKFYSILYDFIYFTALVWYTPVWSCVNGLVMGEWFFTGEGERFMFHYIHSIV